MQDVEETGGAELVHDEELELDNEEELDVLDSDAELVVLDDDTELTSGVEDDWELDDD